MVMKFSMERAVIPNGCRDNLLLVTVQYGSEHVARLPSIGLEHDLLKSQLPCLLIHTTSPFTKNRAWESYQHKLYTVGNMFYS